MEGRNKGLRSIFIIFWVIGSFFWVMIGALEGNFVQSIITISIGWVILFLYFWIKDEYMRKKWNDLEEGYPLPLFMALSISRVASRFLILSRLSWSFLALPMESSTFAIPFLK